MTANEQKIAAAVRRVFRVMRMQSAGGKERFGDWIHRLRDALLPGIADSLLGGLRSLRGGSELGTVGAAVAQQRALGAAQSICETTNEWIADGRGDDEVFGEARIAMIAATEFRWARSQGTLLAAKHGKHRLRWVTKGNPPCLRCKKLEGKVVAAGKPFTRDAEGNPVYHPGLHPHCYCIVEIVRE